jgi:hypothetical protein
MLVAIHNQQTGLLEWQYRELHQCHSLVGSSQHLEMVNDIERNHKYRIGIEHAINHMSSTCLEQHRGTDSSDACVRVLDIGTGTGLLAMLAARMPQVQCVTACELFVPMATLARQIIAENHLQSKIHVIAKRSNDIAVRCDEHRMLHGGEHQQLSARSRRLAQIAQRQQEMLSNTMHMDDGSTAATTAAVAAAATTTAAAAATTTTTTAAAEHTMNERAHVLVTEIFDSELLGEGILPTVRDAIARLLEHDTYTVVPSSATVYAQLVGSASDKQQLLQLWNDTSSFVHHDEMHRCCYGNNSSIALHIRGLLECGAVQALTQATAVLQFDFANPPSEGIHCSTFDVPIVRDGECHAVLYWWELHVAPGVKISTDPYGPQYQWRDHWKQCVYLMEPRHLSSGSGTAALHVRHNDYEIWFGLEHDTAATARTCTCGYHDVYHFERIWMLNDAMANELYRQTVARIVSRFGASDSNAMHVIDIADGSRIGVQLAAHSRWVARIDALEGSQLSMQLVGSRQPNHANVTFHQCSFDAFMQEHHTPVPSEVPLLVVAEPFSYLNSFGIAAHLWRVRGVLGDRMAGMANAVRMVPGKCTLMCAAVNFAHLHRSFASVPEAQSNDANGLDLRLLQRTFYRQESQRQALYALWMYEHTLVSEAQAVLTIDLESHSITNAACGSACRQPTVDTYISDGVQLRIAHADSTIHGIVLWWRYHMFGGGDDDAEQLVLDTRPTQSPSYHRQYVQFLEEPMQGRQVQHGTLVIRVEYYVAAQEGSGVVVRIEQDSPS